MPSKYQPLADHLAAQPATVDAVMLSFSEIEALLGAPLPASAGASGWWTSRLGRTQARAWHGAGWRVTSVRRGQKSWAVTFVRADLVHDQGPR